MANQLMRKCFLIRTTVANLPIRSSRQDCVSSPAQSRLQPPPSGFLPISDSISYSNYFRHNYHRTTECYPSVTSFSDHQEQPGKNQEENKNPFKASNEQLAELREKLTRTLPHFFSRPHDFSVYNRNILFEDNIRNIKTIGINPYAWQITKIKMGAHMKYGKVVLNILKMTCHPEDSTIKIRWRIVSFPGNQVVLAFWKFKLWNQKESLDQYKDEWIDGFSIFYVGSDGLIYKHVCDKVIPDTDNVKSNNPTDKLAEKLGMA